MTDHSGLLPDNADTAQMLLSDVGTASGGTPYNQALLILNEDGTTAIISRTYYGGDGTLMSEWLGRDRVYVITAGADAETLRDMLRDGAPIAVLIDRVHAGHSVDWDGSNMRGELDADAQDAAEELTERLDELPTCDRLAVWSAEAWLCADRRPADVDLGAVAGLSPIPTPEQVRAAAAGLVADARGDSVLISDGVDGMETAIELVIAEKRKRAEEDAVLELED